LDVCGIVAIWEGPMSIVWLILIVTSSAGGHTAVTHIGNFASMPDCEKHAKAFTMPVKPGTPINVSDPSQLITMVCVSANEEGTNPPPG
jgi:hypothetical protein